jgi:6-phosphogluconolactonase
MDRGRRELQIVRDADALAQEAARRIKNDLAQSSGRLAVCLAGGSTPERLYRTLGSEPYRSALPWDRIHWFWGDDRFVSQSDARSNAGMARRSLLNRVPVREEMIHAVATDVESVTDAARAYERDLQRFYGAERIDPARPLFDIVLMGMGRDGHTASLFPGHAELDEQQRWVVGVPNPAFEPFIARVTLTFPVLAAARDMLFLISGENKRSTVSSALAGADLPAGRAHSNGSLVWLIDRAAAPEDPNGA